MPGEFEPHLGTWMLWPERLDNWRLGAKPAQAAFAQTAAAIVAFEPVTMCVSAGQYSHARSCLPNSVRVIEMSSNDAWMRDCGPTFLVNGTGQVRGIDWQFNAWGGLSGGLYFPWDLDEQVARKVLEVERTDYYRAPLVMEGGSIHIDGQGTLLTTRECLLHPNRNPNLSLPQIEAYLKDYLGVQKIIWLPRGVFQDETNGHVDNLCCFVRPGVVALTWTDDASDPQYEISSEAFEYLSQTTDALGRQLVIHKITQPGPLYRTLEESQGVDKVDGTYHRPAGVRMAASYINFYIANGAVIAPKFGVAQDGPAMATLARIFPERKIIDIPGREILLGGGNIHCITQQQPSCLPAR